jgi:hypothetical protein
MADEVTKAFSRIAETGDDQSRTAAMSTASGIGADGADGQSDTSPPEGAAGDAAPS